MQNATMSFAERIDREVFLSFWNTGDIRKMAFVRVMYRDAYPHWPEMQSGHQL